MNLVGDGEVSFGLPDRRNACVDCGPATHRSLPVVVIQDGIDLGLEKARKSPISSFVAQAFGISAMTIVSP
jgi:hypothetical protein